MTQELIQLSNLFRLSTCLIVILGSVMTCAEMQPVWSATGAEAGPSMSEVGATAERPDNSGVDDRSEFEQMARETVARLVADDQFAHDF